MKKRAGYRWGIMALLCLGYMIAYFDRVNLSVAIASDDFKQYFQLTDVDRGNLNSAFFWTYAALQIPAGWLVDRYGVKWPFAFGFLGWSVLSATTAWATSLWQLFAIRFALGVGESMITPAGMRWIRLNVAENQRGLFIGIYMAAAKAGPAVGTLLAGFLLGQSGWRSMFLIIGFGALLWLIPWCLLLRNDDRDLEKAVIAKAGGAAAQVPFWRLVRSPVIIGTVIGTFCYQYFVYYNMTWLPSYFKEECHLDLNEMTAFTFASFAGMAVVATLAGFAADKLIDCGYHPVRVRKAFVIAGFLTASTQLIGAYAESQTVSLFFAVFSLSGLGLMTANYWALTQTLLPGAAVGRIVGLQNCAANLPGIAAPMLTGWLKQTTGGYTAPMLAICVFLVMGIAAYLLLVREEYVPKQPSEPDLRLAA